MIDSRLARLVRDSRMSRSLIMTKMRLKIYGVSDRRRTRGGRGFVAAFERATHNDGVVSLPTR